MSYCNKVFRITDWLYCIKDVKSVNKYLIIGDKKALLFDTGFGFEDFRPLIRQITALPLLVVNSHADCDHAYGNYLFDKVYLSVHDYAALKALERKDFKMKQLQYRLNKPGSCVAAEIVPDWMDHSVYECEYCLIDHGDTFDLGGRKLEVLAVPGHTTGSIALLDRASRSLFSGDSVMKYNVYYYRSRDERRSDPLYVYYNSLKSLWSHREWSRHIFPGHGLYNLDNSIIEDHLRNIEGIYFHHEQDPLVQSGVVDEPFYSHKYKETELLYTEDIYQEMRLQFRRRLG